jgi:5-(carboxyamino)imidazole ribonucleotide mutase/phosphoribosylaminoimidazole-succinocarboxamide synthase
VSRIVILAGSAADNDHVARIAAGAERFGVLVERRIGSAHKTPEHVLALLRAYEADGVPTVFITVAGRSNALSGFVDAMVASPVIACPPGLEAFNGADLWSSIRMPGDVAPLFVMDPANAGLAAAKILAVHDPELRARLAAHKAGEAAKVIAADTAARSEQDGARHG